MTGDDVRERRRGPWALGSIALGLALVGLLCLASRMRHVRSHEWRPLRVPIPITAGTTIERTLTAELDDVYEIELEFAARVPDEVLDDFVRPVEKPSPLDITWEVVEADGGTAIARGDAHDYLYLTDGGAGVLGRMRRQLIGIPFHIEPYRTIERGIGSFEGKAGRRYVISAKVGSTVAALEHAAPHLAVRVSRTRWLRHDEETLATEYTAFGALALAGLCGLAAIARAVLRRRER